MNIPTLSWEDKYDDHGDAVSGVQYAVVDPDGSDHPYGDQSWVMGGGPIRDGGHPEGRIQRRTVTVTYGEWEAPDDHT